MALPDELVLQEGAQFCFADHAGDFSPAAANDLRQGSETDAELELISLADDAARQSDKVDLTASRGPLFSVMAAIECAATPTAGATVDFYWAPSPDSVAANANPGGVSGSDAAYTGYSSNLDDSLQALQFIGSMIVTADATTTVQVGFIGSFMPTERYGTLIVVNRSGAALHSDDVEMHVILGEIVHRQID